MAALKVYGLPMSTCTTRVLTCLHEKQVDEFELVPVDLFASEHKQPPFLSKNVINYLLISSCCIGTWWTR